MDPSSENEIKHPKNDQKQIPANEFWKNLLYKIDHFAMDDPFIPGLIGGLLGFWFATLIFAYEKLFPKGQPSMLYLALCLSWIGALISYWYIYMTQRKLIRNSREEIVAQLNLLRNWEEKN